MASALRDARWALETFAAVSSVLPVRPLPTKAMQMDVLVAGSGKAPSQTTHFHATASDGKFS